MTSLALRSAKNTTADDDNTMAHDLFPFRGALDMRGYNVQSPWGARDFFLVSAKRDELLENKPMTTKGRSAGKILSSHVV